MSRMRILASLAAAFALTVVGGAVAALDQPPSLPPQERAGFVGPAIQFDLPSRITGRTYRIFVYTPAIPPPASGYPAFFTTDGNAMFALAVTQMWVRAGVDLRPAMIVGIGYPTDDYNTLMNKPRFSDLTPPTPASKLAPEFLHDKTPDDFGGAELLYRFIDEELRPRLRAAYPMDPNDQVLYGHSLGGLFALHIMFNHPAAFKTYVASSPSICRADKQVLDGEPAFDRAVESGTVAPRIFIEVGGQEQTPVASMLGLPAAAVAPYNQTLRNARMVDNARDLADRLQAIHGGPGYLVRFHAFEDEDHTSVIPASVSRALTFAFRP